MHNLQTIYDSIMTLKCLTLLKWVVSLIWQAYHKVIKNLFPLRIWLPNENSVEILLQVQFYKISLAFFPLFSKFSSIFVRFMNYLKYIIKYPKHSQTLVSIIIIIIIIIITYQTNIVPKVSFFIASDVFPNVYNKPWRLLSFNEVIQIWNKWESVS